MQIIGKVDHNEKIILLKSKRQRDPQAPKDSSLHQLPDYNKRASLEKKKKKKRRVASSPTKMCISHCEPQNE